MPDTSFVLPLIFQSALVPFAATLAALAAVRALRMGRPLLPVALALGFIAAYFAAFHGQWSPLPRQAMDWLPWLAALASLGAIGIEQVRRRGARLGARTALALLVAGVAVVPALDSIGAQKGFLVLVAAAVFASAAWSLLARAAERGATPPFVLAVSAGGAALTLMLDSSQALGQSSGALAAGLFAVIALNATRLRVGFSGAAAGTAVLLLVTLLADAYVYAGLPLGYVLLLAAGMLADPIVERCTALRHERRGLAAWPMATVLSAVPALATVALAFKAMQDAGGY